MNDLPDTSTCPPVARGLASPRLSRRLGMDTYLAMDTYMVVLRILHIVAGVFWVGAVLVTFLFLQPTAREIGPAAGPFMAHLAGKKKLVDWVLRAAGLTILAGALMYWRISGGLDPDWI